MHQSFRITKHNRKSHNIRQLQCKRVYKEPYPKNLKQESWNLTLNMIQFNLKKEWRVTVCFKPLTWKYKLNMILLNWNPKRKCGLFCEVFPTIGDFLFNPCYSWCSHRYKRRRQGQTGGAGESWTRCCCARLFTGELNISTEYD